MKIHRKIKLVMIFSRVPFFTLTYIPALRCEGRDLNPRNPSILDLKSSAFDQLGNPRSKKSILMSV